jgi:hypothetical protein
MVEVCWSRLEGQDCIRIAGLTPDDAVAVRPVLAVPVEALPMMAGALVSNADSVCFVPRFAPVEGTTYAVLVNGVEEARLERVRPAMTPSTEVLTIYPTAPEVPRNLLRFYVRFSAPMSDASALDHIALVENSGKPLVAAILPLEYELWDPDRTRLTVLLDPARIKRGLVSHRELGYPLQPGTTFQLVVDAGVRDANGQPLKSSANRTYVVGADERRHVDPGAWALTVPEANTRVPVEAAFGRPLDHGLLGRCLRIVDAAGRRVDGVAEIGSHERSWRFHPTRPWAAAEHALVVDAVLEDLAGNSVHRVFDRDLTIVRQEPRGGSSSAICFHPRWRADGGGHC